MVTLRIQELAESKGITLEQLSQNCGISVEKIHKYASESIEIKEETAEELQTLATQLNVTILEVVKPVAKPVAFKLKIQEMAQEKGMTLEELSEKAEVHPAILLFYSTQTIAETQLKKPRFESYLSKISQTLECCNEDLKVPAELPLTSLRLKELAQERGLTLKELGQLTDIPYDVIHLMDQQSLTTLGSLRYLNDSPLLERSVRREYLERSIRETVCEYFNGVLKCKQV
jgi:transcriptional regulator with XRE-family HTH domain